MMENKNGDVQYVRLVTTHERCCCEFLHITTGTWIIAFIQFAIAGACLLFAGMTLTEFHELDEETRWAFLIHLAELVVWSLLIVLLMVGLRLKKSKIIAPHMVACLILIVATVIEMVLIYIANKSLIGLLFLSFLILFLIFCSWIEWHCYRYLEAKEAEECIA